MLHDQARQKINEILEGISFEGHFDSCYDNIKSTQQYELLEWIKDCRDGKIDHLLSKDRNLIGFVKRIGSNLRVILTKRKNGYFLTLFLDKHKYYENEMRKLGF